MQGLHVGDMAKAPIAIEQYRHVALDALLELNGEWHDKQTTSRLGDLNSGGNRIYLAPGLRPTVEKWSGY